MTISPHHRRPRAATSIYHPFETLLLVLALAAACVLAGAAAADAAPSTLQFGAPASLTPADDNSESPRVAVDRRGDAVAVWYDHEADRSLVRASWRPAGGSWSPPVEISSADGIRFISDVGVAITAAGDAIAVWTGTSGPNVDIAVVQAATGSADGGWSAPVDIERTPGGAYPIRLVASPRGDAVAVWGSSNAGTQVVKAATLDRGAGWSAPATLSTPGDFALVGDVGIDDRGNATAIWTTSSADHAVQTAARPADGSWSAPDSLTAPGQAGGGAQIAVNGRGEAIAVWGQGSLFEAHLVTATRSAAGVWSAPAQLAGGGAHQPRIAIGDHDRAVVVWLQFAQDLSSTGIQAATHSAAGGWTAPVQLGSFANNIDVAMTPKGEAVAIWSGWNVVEGATFADGAWTPTGAIATGPEDGPLDYLDVAIGDRGHAVAIWRQWTLYSIGVIQAAASD